MIDRRDILVGSATALTASFLTPSTPALAQATTVPGTKRGFLERPGCRIYYEVTGSGPPIIFAHGLGSNHQTWWQQVPTPVPVPISSIRPPGFVAARTRSRAPICGQHQD